MIVSEIHTNQSIVILGLGRSGIALAEALTQSGAKVLVWDDNPDVLLKACERGLEALNRNKKDQWTRSRYFVGLSWSTIFIP